MKISRYPVFLIVSLIIIFNSGFSQNIVVNEIMSSNKTTILDEDGDTPDWIEFFNPGNEPVNLAGYGLTDDTADLYKWIFPERTIDPQGYLLAFASGKNRTGQGQWETIINWGDNWRYFVPQEELPVNWRLPDFDDSGWDTGPSGFGYGDDDDATIIDPTMSVFIRKTFSVADLPEILDAVLHVDYDDGFVAYLNGQEIARANLGIPGIIPAFDLPATNVIEPLIYQGGYPGAFTVDPALLSPDINVLAIEVHNFDITSSDLTLIPFFSLLFASPPPNPSGTHPLLQLINPKLHTNFKISSSGENILLTSTSGVPVDYLQTGSLPADVSIGRQPDGSLNWVYFNEATPELPNNTQSWPGIAETVAFSLPAGFYSDGLSVSLSTTDPEDIIYYTTDGGEPNIQSTVYQYPIYIFKTTVVRAIAIHTGYLPGKVATATYFIDADSDLPVVSLSTNPAYLFDPEIGIYHDNNIWNDWERPIHVEFYDTDDTIGFAIDAGVKIYGGWTRTLPQKSLAIFAREDYGYNEIDYQIFPDLPFTTYESFVLRNSGNDWMNTMFRDGLMTGLVAEDGIDIPAFRPSVVYINGEYWGIYNIREKISDRYIEQHHNVSHDSLDLLEMSGWPIDGDAAHYDNMIAFIQNNSLSVPANYEYVKTQMDIENFITYEVAQIFICNTDWPGNNIKFWRPKTLGGKWRWIMYDTDFGFGLVYDYTHNTLAFATEPNGPDWPNPPWSTFLLRSLLTNYNFRVDFINRYADLLNSSFRVDRMIEQINQKKAAIINEMPEQINRWGGNMWDWLTNIQVLRNFAYERKNYAQSHVIQYFGLPEYSQVDLNVEPASASRINISTLTLSDFPWSGEYFNGVPVKIKAIPDPGFKFIGWQGNIVSDSADITVIFSNYTELTAVFEAYIPDTIVINEINYHSAPDFNPEDWVEFYNPDDSLVDLTGWVFKDEDDAHSFPFPSGTVIEPYGYLVLCFDTTAFDSLFPEVINNLGNMGFGLSGNGELIRLYDPSGLLIDTVHYNDSLPWPVEPDGNGPTLELIDPSLDNALPESWMASGQHGTPGSENGVYVSVPFDRQTDELDCRINPNPFRGTTTFLFTSNTEQVIRIEIFNLYGERVMTIPHIMLPKGSYYFNWSGNDQNGNVLKPGLYVCKISTEKRAFGRKLIKVE